MRGGRADAAEVVAPTPRGGRVDAAGRSRRRRGTVASTPRGGRDDAASTPRRRRGAVAPPPRGGRAAAGRSRRRRDGPGAHAHLVPTDAIDALDEAPAADLLRWILAKKKLTTAIARKFMASRHRELADALGDLDLVAGVANYGPGFVPSGPVR